MTSFEDNFVAVPAKPESTRPVAAQLWLTVQDGQLRVRADQVVGVQVTRSRDYREDGRKFLLQVITSWPDSLDGDVGPASYVVGRFADEDSAQASVQDLLKSLGTWSHDYGSLWITDTGHVRTSRPTPPTHSA